ncbi:MAG: hypothetical protein M1834_001099 [Cirrosporium novae-zelandiae]|nr:MAG: hypothetical protein M1834_001099 [Cirrosporium novae-zelandiae]
MATTLLNAIEPHECHDTKELSSLETLICRLRAISTGLERIRRLTKCCPDMILALKNEISDLTLVLPEIEGIDRDLERGNTCQYLSITNILFRFHTKIEQFETAVKECLDTCSTTSHRLALNRMKKRRFSRLSDFQGDLRSMRNDLSSALSVASSSGIIRLELALLDITRNPRAVSVARERVSIDEINTVLHRTREMKQEGFAGSGFFETGHNRALETSNTAADQQIVSLMSSMTGHSFNIAQTDGKNATISHIGVTVRRYSPGSCRSWCSCVCHQKCRFNTPQILRDIFGTLFLGYSGVPFGLLKCSKASCKRNTTFSFQATYYFPSWYFSHSVSLGLINNLSGTSLSITMRPIVRRSELYIFAAQGNVMAVRRLLSNRQAHPNEIHERFGNTALHYAIEFGHPDICEALLTEGADPYIENSVGSSAVDKAWALILTSHNNSSLASRLRSLFGDGDVVEEMGFSILHKALLDLIPLSFQSLLEEPSTDVNAVDSGNRTVLSWASQRGDLDAIRQLLEHDADPNICSKLHVTPLHFALRGNNPQCVEMLIRGGASMSARDWGNWPPTHTAAMNQDDPAYMVPLLKAGADVNELLTNERYGKSALHRAAVGNRPRMASFLLDNHAFIDRQSTGGVTPLIEGADFLSIDVVKILLQRGADYTIRDHVGQSILHRIATKADLSLLQAFADIEPIGLNMDDRDALGYSAMDILGGNRDVPITLEFRSAFEIFASQLEARNTKIPDNFGD